MALLASAWSANDSCILPRKSTRTTQSCFSSQTWRLQNSYQQTENKHLFGKSDRNY